MDRKDGLLGNVSPCVEQMSLFNVTSSILLIGLHMPAHASLARLLYSLSLTVSTAI